MHSTYQGKGSERRKTALPHKVLKILAEGIFICKIRKDLWSWLRPPRTPMKKPLELPTESASTSKNFLFLSTIRIIYFFKKISVSLVLQRLWGFLRLGNICGIFSPHQMGIFIF
jgi:hypothetical protein